MNSNMVTPEKFDHLHLVYHFTVPLSPLEIIKHEKTREKRLTINCHSRNVFSELIDVELLGMALPIYDWHS